jgi:hypothetical protein
MEEGSVMLVVTSRLGGTCVELLCSICERVLSRDSAWLVFPPNAERQVGQWVHRDCLQGNVERTCGEGHIVMMRGTAALTALMQSLQGPVARE